MIVGNLTLSDAYDCFPQWDANDSGGNWNSAYDNLSVWTATSVWIDDNTFDDGDHPPTSLPLVYGRPFEVHDGLIDITHGGGPVTMSWNWLQHHDKTDIIGSSDTRTAGPRSASRYPAPQPLDGHRAARAARPLRRCPRLQQPLRADRSLARRDRARSPFFQYYWGAGIESSIVAEQNAIELLPSSPVDHIIAWRKGTELSETARSSMAKSSTCSAPSTRPRRKSSPPLSGGTGRPLRPTEAQPATEVAATVRAGAGAGILNSGTPVAHRRSRHVRAVGRQRLGHRTS